MLVRPVDMPGLAFGVNSIDLGQWNGGIACANVKTVDLGQAICHQIDPGHLF